MQPASLEDRIRAAMAAGDWPTVNRLGQQMDLPRPAPTPTLAGAALWYATQGLPVFPLQAGLKVPQRGTHGVLEASTDLDRIRRWWARWPDANIGLATGHLVDVIDIDGPAGVKTWAGWMGHPDYQQVAILGTVNTPRPGGTHIYLPTDPDLGNGARWLPGIDYRGLGGYVVAPPSVDQHGHRYTWRRPLKLERLAGDATTGSAETGPQPATASP